MRIYAYRIRCHICKRVWLVSGHTKKFSCPCRQHDNNNQED